MTAQQQANAEFQRDVLKTLTEITAKKEEAQRGTQHGLVFEDAVFDFVNGRVAEGDVAERTGNTTGRVRGSKKGDVVVQLGPDRAAAGARIVIEAKQDGSYTLSKALIEIAEARKNRDAGVGMFVFSKQHSAPLATCWNRWHGTVTMWSWYGMLKTRLPTPTW